MRDGPIRWRDNGGSGRPVVLLHGIPTSPLLWRYVEPLLEDLHLLAWEMVGYGHSIPEAVGRDISVAAQADRLLAWVDELRLERPILVGHDLGGGVAQIAAVRAPERFSALVLINSICYDSWPIPSVKTLRAAGSLVAHLPAAALWPIFATLLLRGHDDLAKARESLRLHIRPYGGSGGAEALVSQVRSLRTHDTLEIVSALPTLGLPATVVWGAADRFQKIGYGRRLARDLGANLVAIRGGKHFVPEDHPQTVSRAVRELLVER